MQRQTVAILVILYNKNFEESETLQSIAKFDQKIDQLLIVNNGPSELKGDNIFFKKVKNKHLNVKLKNYVENRPLSWIYNNFVREYDVDYYAFFDDDTKINKDNEVQIFNLNNSDIEIPKIIALSDSKQYYPIVNGLVYKGVGEIDKFSEIFSIGSGLIISKKIKHIFKSRDEEVFDSRFALYGVDISFFRKLNRFDKTELDIRIYCKMEIDHSLSRTEGEISKWREKERLYDEVLTIKYYLNHKVLRLSKCAFKQILNGNWDNLKLIFKTYKVGFHPRCKVI